jgi:molybdenum cofactor cytidylyltransferase
MVGAIVLAAGESTRMQTQKLLLPFGGATVIEHIVDQVTNSAVGDAVVVLGKDAEAVGGALVGRDVGRVFNKDFQSGMLASVRTGIRESAACQGVMIVLGDQPALSTTLINQLVAVWEERRRGIVVPTFEGRRGHPMIFDAAYRDEVLTQFDEEGLRGLLHAHADDVYELAVDTTAILEDIDYPEDYERALRELDEDDGEPR